MRNINCLVIHHSAGLTGSVAAFRAEHKAKGWEDIGYHAVVGNGHGELDGHIGEGRPDAVKGSGVFGANTGKLHICLVGNFASNDAGYTGKPTQRQLRSLGIWLLEKGRRYRIRWSNIKGHKEVAIKGHETLCPGDLPLNDIRAWYLDFTTGRVQVPLDTYLGHKPSRKAEPARQAVPEPTDTPGIRPDAQTSVRRLAIKLGDRPVVQTHAYIIGGHGYGALEHIATALEGNIIEDVASGSFELTVPDHGEVAKKPPECYPTPATVTLSQVTAPDPSLSQELVGG